GHGILKGNFLSGIIGHRKGGLEKWPISIFTLVPRCLCIWKIVRCTGNKSRIAYFAICPVRRNNPFSVRLVEYPLSTLQWNGKTVAKSPHPFHGAKIMIKGSVLLIRITMCSTSLIDRLTLCAGTAKAFCKSGSQIDAARPAVADTLRNFLLLSLDMIENRSKKGLLLFSNGYCRNTANFRLISQL